MKDAHSYGATLRLRPRTQEGQPAEMTDAAPETADEQEYHWEGTWGEEQTFTLENKAGLM